MPTLEILRAKPWFKVLKALWVVAYALSIGVVLFAALFAASWNSYWAGEWGWLEVAKILLGGGAAVFLTFETLKRIFYRLACGPFFPEGPEKTATGRLILALFGSPQRFFRFLIALAVLAALCLALYGWRVFWPSYSLAAFHRRFDSAASADFTLTAMVEKVREIREYARGHSIPTEESEPLAEAVLTHFIQTRPGQSETAQTILWKGLN